MRLSEPSNIEYTGFRRRRNPLHHWQARELFYVAALAGWAFARFGQDDARLHQRDLADGFGARLTIAVHEQHTVQLLPGMVTSRRRNPVQRFRNGHYRMYRKRVSGSSPEELIQSADPDPLSGDWTRDPPRIVYWGRTNSSAVSSTIMALSLVPGSKPGLIDGGSARKFGPRVSPSGRWVAYTFSK